MNYEEKALALRKDILHMLYNAQCGHPGGSLSCVELMMALYYERDLNLREIGEVMGVSESRVCQLHSQAVMRLRTRLAGAVDKKRKKIEKNG